MPKQPRSISGTVRKTPTSVTARKSRSGKFVDVPSPSGKSVRTKSAGGSFRKASGSVDRKTSGQPTPQRKSVPLDGGELQAIDRLKNDPEFSAALAALSAVAITRSSSDASVLRAVVAAGLKAVEEVVEERGYAEMAKHDDVADRQAAARRRAPSWANE